MTADEVRALLRDQCANAGSRAAWLRERRAAGYQMTSALVSFVLSGRLEPCGKVLAALGLRRVVTYERTGG